MINDEIVRLRAKNKPIYAVVETCASAAYYIAAAADEIYVDKASIVGSIGVLMDGLASPAPWKSWGEASLAHGGQQQRFSGPLQPAKRAAARSTPGDAGPNPPAIHWVVKKGRGSALKIADDTFSGLFWTGQQAVDMGLADRLGSLDYVAREVVKAEGVIDYTRR